MKLYIAEKDHPLCTMMREVSLKTLSNVNIRDPSHDKNIPIIQYIYILFLFFNSVGMLNVLSYFLFCVPIPEYDTIIRSGYIHKTNVAPQS